MTTPEHHNPEEGPAVLDAILAVPGDAPTACSGWTAHDLVAHLAAGAAELADLLERRLDGRPDRPTRPFDEREAPFRAATHDELLGRLVDENIRMLQALEDVRSAAEPSISFTGTTMTVDQIELHTRSEAALHRWDLVGSDDVSRRLLAQPELTRHAVSVLNAMPILDESARGMGRRMARSGLARRDEREGSDAEPGSSHPSTHPARRLVEDRHRVQDRHRVPRELGLGQQAAGDIVAPDEVPAVQRGLAARVQLDLAHGHRGAGERDRGVGRRPAPRALGPSVGRPGSGPGGRRRHRHDRGARRRAVATHDAVGAPSRDHLGVMAARSVSTRIGSLDWADLARQLDDHGYAVTPDVLTAAECRTVARMFDDDERYRSVVDMRRHRFGSGIYKYFDHPLPPIVDELRHALYPPLAEVANGWMARLGRDARFPDSLDEFLEACHAGGQRRPTPLLFRYEEDDFNALHQDLYGAIAFPLQVVTVLDRPGTDYTGGELLLVTQTPRTQSVGEVVVPGRGQLVIFPNAKRPVPGQRGDHAVTVRHGVSRLRSGRRHALGLIFHDAT